MTTPTSPQVLGRVVATERRPNTPHEFHFWTALDAPVGIGTIVRVDSERPINGVLPAIYGVVTEGFGYTDLQTPLHDVLGADGQPGASQLAPTERTEIRLYTAAVLRHVPEEPLQPVPMGSVHLASEADVQAALRMDSYAQGEQRRAIPVGMYRAGGTQAGVHLDADFLLGPEAAHLSISGVSGLATKTSAVEWLLASIFAHFPQEKGGVAAVCFNVKGPDLCFLDQPASQLDETDRGIYEALGIPAEPFRNVRYFAPWTAKGYQLATLRSNEALQGNVQPLTWGLRETLEYAEVLLNKDDVDAKADALIDFIKERVLDQVFTDDELGLRAEVRTFGDLERWFSDLLRGIENRERQSDVWRTHHVATIRKVRNRLSNISTRCKGLVTDDGTVSDLPFGEFEDRAVYVVDVANLEEDAQDLVFARVVSQLRESLEKRQLGVSQVVVFVDELNKYAPNDGPDTYVRKMLLDIAERGRYLGMVLFGAQQFRSQVHRRVVGNSGTALYGRMDPDELATPGYQTLAPATKARLATLEKGQLMVRHPHFGQPIFVRFPRPAVLAGREGVERFPPAEDLPLDAALTRALRRLDPNITLAAVQKELALAGDSEDEIIQARNRTIQTRPENVLAFFRSQLRKRVDRQAVSRAPTPALRATPEDDPYGG
ncbi:MAG: ATP-binding protein [Gemmatimonadaceae bacterium]|nr:ATP-binding protein [Gemmatimonadaceae bacterium]